MRKIFLVGILFLGGCATVGDARFWNGLVVEGSRSGFFEESREPAEQIHLAPRAQCGYNLYGDYVCN